MDEDEDDDEVLIDELDEVALDELEDLVVVLASGVQVEVLVVFCAAEDEEGFFTSLDSFQASVVSFQASVVFFSDEVVSGFQDEVVSCFQDEVVSGFQTEVVSGFQAEVVSCFQTEVVSAFQAGELVVACAGGDQVEVLVVSTFFSEEVVVGATQASVVALAAPLLDSTLFHCLRARWKPPLLPISCPAETREAVETTQRRVAKLGRRTIVELT